MLLGLLYLSLKPISNHHKAKKRSPRTNSRTNLHTHNRALPSIHGVSHSLAIPHHARSHPRSSRDIKGKAHPHNRLAHTSSRPHSVTDTLLHAPLPRPQGSSGTDTALRASSPNNTGTGSAGPYSQAAQRVPDSELAASRRLTREPADTGPVPHLNAAQVAQRVRAESEEPLRSAPAAAEGSTSLGPLDAGQHFPEAPAAGGGGSAFLRASSGNRPPLRARAPRAAEEVQLRSAGAASDYVTSALKISFFFFQHFMWVWL
ncbi:unnamed protein product [Nyctereutes procyonoides]|uniref:(raccoon dog) hypothetical protein n=1 Tax=Nyctereutes procyonoides TaxID=34880 RepID=A0A811ZVS6_NYCPR|nr:unnamed protein product [Nyctereutes procyonoides]